MTVMRLRPVSPSAVICQLRACQPRPTFCSSCAWSCNILLTSGARFRFKNKSTWIPAPLHNKYASVFAGGHNLLRSRLTYPIIPHSKFSTSKMADSATTVAEQFFDYFLVLDFEATCSNERKMTPQEIIEFPVLKVNGKTFDTEAIFHQYVEPRVHKELTPFCTELTGIVQEMVDGEPHLETVLQMFDEWMTKESLKDPAVKSVFVTCGDWDLKTMLPGQCKYFNIPPAMNFSQWINIKQAFCDVTGKWPKGMMPMLEMLNLRHQGRHHSGIDDCKNIANILKKLAQTSYKFKVTGVIK